jgi:hypothetical protein
MSMNLIISCLLAICLGAAISVPGAVASPELTNSEGATLPVGSSLRSVPGTFKFTASNGSAECTAIELTTTVTTNTGTKIKGEIPLQGAVIRGTDKFADCTSPQMGAVNLSFLSKLCWETLPEDKIIFTGCGANVRLTVKYTALAIEPCEYTTASITGNFSTATNATLTVSEGSMGLSKGSVFFCMKTGYLDFHLVLATTNLGEVFIS